MSTYTDIRYDYNLPSGFGGGLNLLATNTITSGVSSSSFTSGIDSSYRTYMFKFINMHPATDNVSFQFNGSIDGGSNYNVTKTTTIFFGYHDESIRKSSNCIFLCIVRNPYDWIYAINKDKHHIPPENHDIKKFVTNEWYSIIHDELDKRYGEELLEDRDYETNHRYSNIFAMRSKKLKYLITEKCIGIILMLMIL